MSARERLATAKARLRALREEFDTARVWTPTPEDLRLLSQEGIRARRQEVADQAQAKYAPQLRALMADITEDRDMVRREADRARPKLADSATALMRAQVAWDNVKDQLAAGRLPSSVLANADRDTVLAVREWGPAYLEGQAYRANPGSLETGGFVPPDHTALARAVDARLAQLDDSYGAAHQALAEAESVVAYVEPLAGHRADPQVSGLNDMGAAVVSHYAEQSAAMEHSLTAADPHTGDDADAGVTQRDRE